MSYYLLPGRSGHCRRAARLALPATACSIDWRLCFRNTGADPDPGLPHRPGKHSNWLARMAGRYRWVRVLLHVAAMVRSRRNFRWHLNCIWREIHESLHSK
jgi:hypothetical protein